MANQLARHSTHDNSIDQYLIGRKSIFYMRSNNYDEVMQQVNGSCSLSRIFIQIFCFVEDGNDCVCWYWQEIAGRQSDEGVFEPSEAVHDLVQRGFLVHLLLLVLLFLMSHGRGIGSCTGRCETIPWFRTTISPNLHLTCI